MMGRGLFLVLYWTLPIVSYYVHKTNANVSCKAGTFAMGGPGSVTCDFGKNIRKQQHNFNVVQYGLQSPNTANYWLLCNWVSSDPECTIKDGLTFALIQDGTGLTINIASVDAPMAGTVVCQLVPDEGLQTTPCDIAIVLGGKNISDAQVEAVSQAFQSSADNSGVFIGAIVVIAIIAVLLLLFGCLAIYLLVFTWLRYTIVRREKLADDKQRGWGDICLCRHFQAGLVRFHVCQQRVDEEDVGARESCISKEEAGAGEMCMSKPPEFESKEVQCEKKPVTDNSTNTNLEGVNMIITVHTQDSATTASSPSLPAVTANRPVHDTTAGLSKQKKGQVASRSSKKPSKDKDTVSNAPLQQENQSPTTKNDVSRESVTNPLARNTESENNEKTQAMTTVESEEEQVMMLSAYENEPKRRHASLDEHLHQDQDISTSSSDNNESQVSETEGDVENDQSRSLVRRDKPDSRDAKESCSIDEASPLDRDGNTVARKLSRLGKMQLSFRKLTTRL